MFLTKIINIISACGSIFLGCGAKVNIEALNNVVDNNVSAASVETMDTTTNSGYSLSGLVFGFGKQSSSTGKIDYSSKIFTDTAFEGTQLTMFADTSSVVKGFVTDTIYYCSWNVVLDVVNKTTGEYSTITTDLYNYSFKFDLNQNMFSSGMFTFEYLEYNNSYVKNNYKIVSGSSFGFNYYIYTDSARANKVFDFNFGNMIWSSIKSYPIIYGHAPIINKIIQNEQTLVVNASCSSSDILPSGSKYKLRLKYNDSSLYYDFDDLFETGSVVNIASNWPSNIGSTFSGFFTWVYSDKTPVNCDVTISYDFNRPFNSVITTDYFKPVINYSGYLSYGSAGEAYIYFVNNYNNYDLYFYGTSYYYDSNNNQVGYQSTYNKTYVKAHSFNVIQSVYLNPTYSEAVKEVVTCGWVNQDLSYIDEPITITFYRDTSSVKRPAILLPTEYQKTTSNYTYTVQIENINDFSCNFIGSLFVDGVNSGQIIVSGINGGDTVTKSFNLSGAGFEVVVSGYFVSNNDGTKSDVSSCTAYRCFVVINSYEFTYNEDLGDFILTIKWSDVAPYGATLPDDSIGIFINDVYYTEQDYFLDSSGSLIVNIGHKSSGTFSVRWCRKNILASVSFGIGSGNYEVVDITHLLLQIVEMPFYFFQNAFNITIFSGTTFEMNVSQLILAVFGIIISFVIIKKILEMLM